MRASLYTTHRDLRLHRLLVSPDLLSSICAASPSRDVIYDNYEGKTRFLNVQRLGLET